MQVQVYKIIQSHDDAILTHILGSFAENLVKSDDGLERKKNI
jgi:hypothetical protein